MIVIYAILAIFAVFGQAFFTASEMAVTAINKIKFKASVDEGDPNALKLNDFLKEDGKFLGTTLAGTNLAVIIASVFVTRVFSEYFDPRLASILTTAVMVPVTLVFAEIIPKTVALQFSTQLALKVVTPLIAVNRMLGVLVNMVNRVSGAILRPFRKGKGAWDLDFTKRDLKSLLVSGHEAGEVEKDELEIIQRVMDFGGKQVRGSMIPIYRVYAVDIEDNIDDVKKLISLTGFSRIPVYTGRKDNISGVINIYDILFSREEESDRLKVSDFMREPVSVRDDDGLDIALTRLRHKKQPMGVVLNSEDKVIGIITIEDMLEELVGQIEDKAE